MKKNELDRINELFNRLKSKDYSVKPGDIFYRVGFDEKAAKETLMRAIVTNVDRKGVTFVEQSLEGSEEVKKLPLLLFEALYNKSREMTLAEFEEYIDEEITQHKKRIRHLQNLKKRIREEIDREFPEVIVDG